MPNASPMSQLMVRPFIECPFDGRPSVLTMRRCATYSMPPERAGGDRTFAVHLSHQSEPAMRDMIYRVRWEKNKKIGDFLDELFPRKPPAVHDEAISRNLSKSSLIRVFSRFHCHFTAPNIAKVRKNHASTCCIIYHVSAIETRTLLCLEIPWSMYKPTRKIRQTSSGAAF